ncbi:MAG TPA: phosphatidate cytidylyltransferase [Candidatus Angelobacter sp.]|nr:phosphatidate cytidylyltransferase [Candidatus Angelobacter sp.]
MKRVLTAVILIPVVLLLLFKAPDWLYSAALGVIALLAVHEYFGIARHYQERLWQNVVLAATGLYFAGHCLHKVSAFGWPEFGNSIEIWLVQATGYQVLPLLLLLLGLVLRDLRQALPAAAISYLGFLYIGITLGELSLIGHTRYGRILIFVFLITVWSGDIFAYYAGRAFGRHKLAPSISPGKTWEGAIASAMGAVIICVALFHYIHAISSGLASLDSFPSRSVFYADAGIVSPPIWLAAIFGLCVNIAAQLGDLTESALKRGAGVKDSGTLLPGHGGILDRIDAMLLAAPVLWFFQFVLYRAIIHK